MKLLITGANRGLGLSLTTEAVKRGHLVFAGVRNPDKKANALNQLQALFPNQVYIIPLDVADEGSCQLAFQTIKKDYKSLDVIINNAGILNEREKTIEDIDMSQVELTFNINLFGPMRIVKYFLPILNKGPESSVINISSEAGSYQNAYGGDYPYAISKNAVNLFTQQLRHYLVDDPVLVLAIHPGWIKTDMGGEQAPGSPEESARGIFDIIEKKTELKSDASFLNHKGDPMPL